MPSPGQRPGLDSRRARHAEVRAREPGPGRRGEPRMAGRPVGLAHDDQRAEADHRPQRRDPRRQPGHDRSRPDRSGGAGFAAHAGVERRCGRLRDPRPDRPYPGAADHQDRRGRARSGRGDPARRCRRARPAGADDAVQHGQTQGLLVERAAPTRSKDVVSGHGPVLALAMAVFFFAFWCGCVLLVSPLLRALRAHGWIPTWASRKIPAMRSVEFGTRSKESETNDPRLSPITTKERS